MSSDQSPLPQDTHELHHYFLQRVSRTFALTIPQLPSELQPAVANAYLLCRMVDTIEDDPALSWPDKHYYCQLFIQALRDQDAAQQFARQLTPRLSQHIPADEQQLIAETPRIVAITQQLPSNQQAILGRCVAGMAQGMLEFEQQRSLAGLKDLDQLGRYCYFVAGIVGELLTELFIDHLPALAGQRDQLMKQAVAFGQGLQMTNILKDIWDDYHRGYCWLPAETFAQQGYDLHTLTPKTLNPQFRAGLQQLIALARYCLQQALDYTLQLPRSALGLRRFCLQALFMAVLTLRKLYRYGGFDTQPIKIRRSTVKATVVITHSVAGHNRLLRLLFALTCIGLPKPPSTVSIPKVSP